MKVSKQKLLIWGGWVIILLLICVYFVLDSTYNPRPLLSKLGKELYNIGLPYVFFTFFYVLAFTQKQYRKMLYLIVLDITCIMFIVGSIYWFYEGKTLAVFSGILFISFATIKTLVLIVKNKSTKA